MLRLASAVLLATALVSGSALSAEQSQESQARLPSYLDTSRYGGGDGLSKKTAVVVKIESEAAGIRAEYAWIASRYPGAKPLSQALTAREDDGKQYDVITLRTSAGAQLILWFDISAMSQ